MIKKNKKIIYTDKDISLINWKAIDFLKQYVSRFGNIKPRKYTGNSVKYQKKIRNTIIRARELGLLLYIK